MKFRSVQLFNLLVSFLGLGLCSLTVLLYLEGLSFPIVMITGVSGTVVTVLGFSTLFDLHRFRQETRNHHFN